ncbi:substrate-binding domain-containing protein [Azohydromonas aeria]|uniref:substrate-binding domain-containing protein n=1 Tax=Azohydromonas aeria TaxID=2590212 RepID=UPI0018DF975B|nr:substrate-binding domain-containing protein [Azohydromonas aeria]
MPFLRLRRSEAPPAPMSGALRRRRAWLAGGVWALALLAGCDAPRHPAVSAVTAEPAASQAAPPAPAQTRVALIMKTLTNPFFVEMERGARRAQQEAGVELQVRTATQETSIEQQIQLVGDAVRAGARAIVIAPGDSARLVPALKSAQDAGIAVVNIDNRLDAEAMAAAGMRPVPFVGVDNEQGAFAAARHLAARVPAGEPAEAAIIEGIRGADNARQRLLGAERGLGTNPRIRIVARESANWKIDEAHAVAARIFKRHPRVSVLVCANDMMAIGALKYLQESGRGDVLVGGFDALAEVLPALRAGQLAVTVDQQAAEQGYLGVKTALALLAGASVPPQQLIDSRLVTARALQ